MVVLAWSEDIRLRHTDDEQLSTTSPTSAPTSWRTPPPPSTPPPFSAMADGDVVRAVTSPAARAAVQA